RGGPSNGTRGPHGGGGRRVARGVSVLLRLRLPPRSASPVGALLPCRVYRADDAEASFLFNSSSTSAGLALPCVARIGWIGVRRSAARRFSTFKDTSGP